MNGTLSNCVAWGVDDLEEALAYYRQAFGFDEKQRGEGWIEIDTRGPAPVRHDG